MRYASRRNLVVSPTRGRSIGRLRVFICMQMCCQRDLGGLITALPLMVGSTRLGDPAYWQSDIGPSSEFAKIRVFEIY